MTYVKTYLAAIAVVCVLLGCTQKVPVTAFGGIYPGMGCAELDAYLARQKMPVRKDGMAYKFALEDGVWKDAVVRCDGVVGRMEFSSTTGTTIRFSQAYINLQDALLDAFRDNAIIYEEGNKVINLGNGIELSQFIDAKLGIVTGFKVSADNMNEAKEAWEKTAALLPKVVAEK